MTNVALLSCVVMTGAYFLMTVSPAWSQQGETRAPYTVLETGVKMKFADLTKNEMGLRCSVYLKDGQAYKQPTSTMASSSFVQRGSKMIIDGELSELNRHGIYVGWFGDSGSAEWIPIREDQIDYIILEKASPDSK